MKDEDITAFRTVPAGPSTAAPPRSWWPWVLLGLVACFVLLLAAAGAALAGLADLAGSKVSISVDDETISLGSLHAGHGVVAIAALAAALLVVLVVVPVVLFTALGAAALAVGVALVAALLVTAVAASPLLMIGALVWWALRRRPAAPTASSSA